MTERRYYEPVNRGLEIRIAEKLAQLRQANAEVRDQSHDDQDTD